MDIAEMAERDERAMERIASALEAIAKAMTMGYKLDAQRFEIEHPVRPAVREALVTRIPDAFDLLKEDQGASDEPIDQWTELGPRERDLVERAKAPAPVRESRVDKKAGGARPAKGK